MKIGIDAKRAFANRSGLGNYSRWMIDSLLKFYPEHEYFLFAPHVSQSYRQRYEPLPNVRLVAPETLIGRSFASLWRTYAIADIAKHLQLDVYHGLSNELPVGIDRFEGKKLVSIHDLIFIRFPQYYNNIDRFIYTRKFRYAAEKADLVIASSIQTQKDLHQFFRTEDSKIRVVYQNCSELFHDRYTDSEIQPVLNTWGITGRYILCVGTPEERKNQMTLLRAFHQLQPDSVKLVFVGKDNAYAAIMRDYIAQHQLEQHVFLLHQVPHEDLPLLYRGASVFVYNSTFEGFGIPILEALRTGVPVITSNVSSMPEVAGEAALYVHPRNEESVQAALHELLTDSKRVQELIAKGKQQAQQFDTPVLLREVMDLYTS